MGVFARIATWFGTVAPAPEVELVLAEGDLFDAEVCAEPGRESVSVVPVCAPRSARPALVVPPTPISLAAISAPAVVAPPAVFQTKPLPLPALTKVRSPIAPSRPALVTPKTPVSLRALVKMPSQVVVRLEVAPITTALETELEKAPPVRFQSAPPSPPLELEPFEPFESFEPYEPSEPFEPPEAFGANDSEPPPCESGVHRKALVALTPDNIRTLRASPFDATTLKVDLDEVARAIDVRMAARR